MTECVLRKDACDTSAVKPSSTNPVRLAVFDFDGTSIKGNSPVLLVRHLIRRRMLSPSVILRILVWAFAYKCRLPQNEAWVRCLVFRAFRGRPVEEVDRFLRSFYDDYIALRFRREADEAMSSYKKSGVVVVVVSATFEPIVVRAMESHPFDYAIATKMRIEDNKTYTNEVDGLPVEGPQKLCAVRDFADRAFGANNWTLAFAYGDHHSDQDILAAAEVPYAVDPDRALQRIARRRGWEILDW